jgi:outer membrane receptor protein involved in Fe transport
MRSAILASGVCLSIVTLTAAPLADAQGVAGEDARNPDALTEVIVTATKREERLQDVAAPISAVTGRQLQEMGAQSLSDYITTLPGVQFNDYQPGVSEVIIRGVSATTYHEQGQTVVGYYINEIPLAEAGWPIVIPDVDTFDLDRVEVLRGPQGSLFGAAALGGLVNYIAREADPSGFDSAVEAMLGSTRNAGEENYSGKGMLNMPLIDDKLAVRVVGLQRFDAGFVDNITTGQQGSSDLTTRGGRLSAVYEPSDRTKVSWLTFYQDTALEDQTYVIIGTLDRDTVVREPHDTEMMINSLRLDQDVGFGTLTLLGAVAEKDGRIVFDTSRTGWLQGPVPTEAVSNVGGEARHFEARLASNDDESRIGWLVGAAWYDSEKDTFDVTSQPGAAAFIDANPGLFGGNPGSLLAPNDFINRYVVDQTNEDAGLFGELSFKVTDTVTLTAGGRYFDTKSDTTVSRPPSANFVGAFDAVGSSFRELQDETGFTPKVSLAFRPSESFMVYALYSQGFRVGGANPNPPGLTGVPTSYDSDTVDNYEIGLRTSLAGDRVFLDTTVFRIDWSDIQVRLFTPAPFFYSYVTNAGEAQIDGVEFSGTWRATRAFDLRAAVTYQDAAVSEFLPDTFAPGGGHAPGTVLPGSSEWSTSETATFRLESVAWAPRLEVSHRYLSDAPVAFSSPNSRGEFNIWDVRASATVREGVTVSLFANNVSDEYGVMNAPFADFFVPPLGSVTRPRSYGLRVNLEL